MRESNPNLLLDLDAPFSVDMELFSSVYRDRLPTLRDWDPLRHDVIRVEPPPASDTRPTLPDIDPLRHDLPS